VDVRADGETGRRLLTIPPIERRQRTQPAAFDPIVAPQRVAVAGEADIFLDAEVDFEETYVQAQVLYTAEGVPRGADPAAAAQRSPKSAASTCWLKPAGDERSYERS
jgi:hypothetical protein